MTGKRVTFDEINLGCPVHSDPFEMENTVKKETLSRRASLQPLNAFLSDKSLKEELEKESKNLHSDFYVRDPSSSEDSDYELPETISEQVRRVTFAKRRRMHYTEFSTVELARRLVCEEFASETSSVKSGDSAFRSQQMEEECPPCMTRSSKSFPFLQYDNKSIVSQDSGEESIPKEDPEPGFDPSHPCYPKLMGPINSAFASKHRRPPGATPQPTAVSPESLLERNILDSDFQESLARHTRVVDHGEKWDLQESRLHQVPSKASRGRGSYRARGSGKPVGFRSL